MLPTSRAMRERYTCGSALFGLSRAARVNSPTASSRWPRCQYSTPRAVELFSRRPKMAQAPTAMIAMIATATTGRTQGFRSDGSGTGCGVPRGDIRRPFVDMASPGLGVCLSAGGVMSDASSFRNPSRAALMSASVG
jgi:hypothetical protein